MISNSPNAVKDIEQRLQNKVTFDHYKNWAVFGKTMSEQLGTFLAELIGIQ